MSLYLGRLAEGLGTGLQNLLLRFKSGSDLKRKALRKECFSCIMSSECQKYYCTQFVAR